jgi:hypothetical protein
VQKQLTGEGQSISTIVASAAGDNDSREFAVKTDDVFGRGTRSVFHENAAWDQKILHGFSVGFTYLGSIVKKQVYSPSRITTAIA